MPGHDRDMDGLIEFVRGLPGWTVELTKKNHHKIRNPQGRMLNLGGTPGDRRSLDNSRTALRRLGAPIPSKHQPKKVKRRADPR